MTDAERVLDRAVGRRPRGPVALFGLRSSLRTRSWRIEVAVAVAVVYLPLVVDTGFGLLLGGTTGKGGGYSAGDLFTHNLRVGLATSVIGIPTFGVLALVAACLSGFANGYGMGVVAVDDGLVKLAIGLPHFLPETLASVLFVAVGIGPALRTLRRYVLDQSIEPLRDSAGRWALFLALGSTLLVIAAYLEALTA